MRHEPLQPVRWIGPGNDDNAAKALSAAADGTDRAEPEALLAQVPAIDGPVR